MNIFEDYRSSSENYMVVDSQLKQSVCKFFQAGHYCQLQKQFYYDTEDWILHKPNQARLYISVGLLESFQKHVREIEGSLM